ncbi:MAG TPA: MBL fold metallo-hydrolase [Acidobacteriaceae bacterium]|nr:MBL fold metallo-hydrolase [Acidobacteriaceae bacterium]
MQAELILLGSGTSMGVPTLGCGCPVCTSTDARDRRTRPSIAIQFHDGEIGRCVLIDTGPDFRHQALRENIRRVDAVLYTHSHADHILGLDDLRPLSFQRPEKIPLYADATTTQVLRHVFGYTFAESNQYPHKARVELHPLDAHTQLFGADFITVPLLHGTLQTVGFRFGNAAYLTDMSDIPEASFRLLQGLDVLILDALRRTPHPSHSNLDSSVRFVQKIGPRRAWFTHMSHDLGQVETEKELPLHIRLAYDGLRIPIEL